MKPSPEQEAVLHEVIQELQHVRQTLNSLERNTQLQFDGKRRLRLQAQNNSLVVIQSGRAVDIQDYKQKVTQPVLQEIESYRAQLNALQAKNHSHALQSIIYTLLLISFAAGWIIYLQNPIADSISAIAICLGGIVFFGFLAAKHTWLSWINADQISQLKGKIDLRIQDLQAIEQDVEEIIKAEVLLQTRDFRQVICPSLRTVADDAMEIAKLVTPALLTAALIEQSITFIPNPVFIAAVVLLILRVGASTLCSE